VLAAPFERLRIDVDAESSAVRITVDPDRAQKSGAAEVLAQRLRLATSPFPKALAEELEIGLGRLDRLLVADVAVRSIGEGSALRLLSSLALLLLAH
jgi:hypothetical protein